MSEFNVKIVKENSQLIEFINTKKSVKCKIKKEQFMILLKKEFFHKINNIYIMLFFIYYKID